MTEKAERLIEWESTDGSVETILLVTDESKDRDDIEFRRLERASKESREDQYSTTEILSYIDEISNFSIPEKVLD